MAVVPAPAGRAGPVSNQFLTGTMEH